MEETSLNIHTYSEKLMLEENFVWTDDLSIEQSSSDQIVDFFKKIPTMEKELGQKIVIQHDKKTDVNFIECHISAATLSKNMDLDAVIDPENQEDYRANRNLQPKNPDYLMMLEDAKDGRQFSDIVVEYNTGYKKEKPLKVLGGQHRSSAIQKNSAPESYHGIRAYFDLDVNKRVELYKISNTNIQVPEDLLDRLDEQSLTPPGTLREFAHEIGLLQKNKDFGEKRSSDEPFLPTVRMVRTFIVNFNKGKSYKGDFDSDAIVPYLTTAGGQDNEYKKIFAKNPHFKNESDLLEAGKNFVNLHTNQFQKIDSMDIQGKAEFRMKSLSLAVLSSWAYTAGLLQQDPERLKKFYSLANSGGKDDPLNAKAMSKARLDDVDPENYRGLGTRTSPSERGRILTLFLQFASSDKKKITKDMCNTAIRVYHANDAKTRAERSRKRAFG